MSLRQTTSKLVGTIAFVGLALLGNAGCGSESPLPPPDTTASATDSAPSDGVAAIGDAIGTVRDGHLEFTELTMPGTSEPGSVLENFGKSFSQSKVSFATPAGGPAGVAGTPAPCTTNQYCADVNLINNTTEEMDNTFVEVTDYFNVVPTGTTITWAGVPFPLSTAYSNVFVNSSNISAANYGTILAGATGTFHWVFNAGGSTTFSFHIKIYASFPRPTLVGSIYKGAGAAPAIDACSGANADGVTTFFTSGDEGEQSILLPFPITSLTTTYDHAVIGANGYVLFYNLPGSVPTVPTANTVLANSGPPGLYPFWDDLGYDSDGGVCVSTSGATPNRLWRVTWKNAKISTNQPTKPSIWNATNQRVTYSISVQESTDVTRYYYAAPTVITALNQGQSASCGWRGPNPPAKGGTGCGSFGAIIPTFPEAIVYSGIPGNP
jgi:hypothetical protein